MISNADKSKQEEQQAGGALRDSEASKIAIHLIPDQFIRAMDRVSNAIESYPMEHNTPSPEYGIRKTLYRETSTITKDDFLWVAYLLTAMATDKFVPCTTEHRPPFNVQPSVPLAVFSPKMVLRLARIFQEGAKYYGEDNWKKGMPIERVVHSLKRHFEKAIAMQSGTDSKFDPEIEKEEDHFAMAVWNCCVAWWYLEYEVAE